MLFSDEWPFVLRFHKNLRKWRRRNERYNPECTKASVKHNNKIMVWGYFSARGVGRLARVEGIMEQVQYREILEEQIVPSAKDLFREGGWTFNKTMI